jgi:hypothetical protein
MNSGWREPPGQWARLRSKQPDGPVRGEAGRNQTRSCAAVPPPARGLTGQMLRVSVADFHSARYWRSEALEERDGRRLPVPARSGGGRLTEPTPAVEPGRRERVKVPHTCRSHHPPGWPGKPSFVSPTIGRGVPLSETDDAMPLEESAAPPPCIGSCVNIVDRHHRWAEGPYGPTEVDIWRSLSITRAWSPTG